MENSLNTLATAITLAGGILLTPEAHGRGPDPEIIATARDSREAIANTGAESGDKKTENKTNNESEHQLEVGPFVVKPHVNLITNGTLACKQQEADEKPCNFSGGIAMLQARALAVTRPGVLPNDAQVGALVAGGWVGDNLLPLGKVFVKTPRLDLELGQANGFSSTTFVPPYLSGKKIDTTFYNLTPKAPNFDRYARLSLNIGPKRERLIQVFGGVRAGGLKGPWNPTGVVGLNYNDGHSSAKTQFHFEVGDNPNYFAEVQYRYANVIGGKRFELSTTLLAHSGPDGTGQRQNTVGGSAFAAVGLGEGLGNRSRVTPYVRLDLGGQLDQGSVNWNAIAGASIIPVPGAPVSLAPQASVGRSGDGPISVNAGLTAQVEF